ncbi:MAG: adenine deaminase [Candidatus Heimdallarchaeaceae archaeon]
MRTEEIISYAMAEKKASLILRGGKVANVYTRELIDADVVITDNYIVYVGKNTEDFEGEETQIIELKNKIICPGLIESHIHVESSMLSLTEFSKVVVSKGTTTCVIDPHEIANVCGIEGIDLFIEESKELPVKFLIEAPSCVPSLSGFETPGAELDVKKIKKLLKKDEIFGLAEMMNFPGVYLRFPDVLGKIDAAKKSKKIVEGHAPLLTNKELQAYIAAGISSDHEATTAEEALEKLRLGMKLQIREGSFAKDLENIFSDLIKYDIDYRNIIIASDDRNPIDLVEKGHLDYSFRKLVKLGVDPIKALQMFTINTATHLKLDNKIGGISPGKIADIVVVNDLENFNVEMTIVEGKIIYRENKVQQNIIRKKYPKSVLETMKFFEVPSVNDLMIDEEEEEITVNVIGLKEHSLITEHLQLKLKATDGYLQPDLEQDILPVFVINRHTPEKNIGKGFIQGLGIKEGALASTIAHDCHQVICTGTSYELIIQALQKIKEIGGGQVVVTKNSVATLPLKIAGLMSTETSSEVVKKIRNINQELKKLQPALSEPFMALAFVALPVIPHLKITDKGLVNVDAFSFIELKVLEK